MLFVLGLQDRYGVTLVSALVSVWISALISVFYAKPIISLLPIFISMGATVYGSWLLLKFRADLKFRTRSAQELAFPTSDSVKRLSFRLHALIFAFAYVPSVALLTSKERDIIDEKVLLAVSVFFIIGHMGIIGISLQTIKKVKGMR